MDRMTLESLYDTYAEPLFRYLCSMVHRESEARDRLQDLFLKIARNPGCLDEVTDVRAYLFRLAHNLVIDGFRRSNRRDQTKHILALDTIPIFATTCDPDAQALRAGMAVALTELPIAQREVVYLKLYEEMTFEAIADLLELSPNTTASRYRYGIEKLRCSLKPLYDDIT